MNPGATKDRAYDVPRIPTPPPIYLLIQYNSMQLFYAHASAALSLSLLPLARFPSFSHPFSPHLSPTTACSSSLSHFSRVQHLAPPVRNAKTNLTLGGPNVPGERKIFSVILPPAYRSPRYASANTSSGASYLPRERARVSPCIILFSKYNCKN